MKRNLTGVIALIAISLLLVLTPSCGPSGGASPPKEGGAQEKGAMGVNPHLAADADPILITEFQLDDLLSGGLPVILNFGDGGAASMDTLASLAILHRDIGELVLIRSVDLAKNPAAKEGFPVQIMPTQFFYASDGRPIQLPLDIGVTLSSFNDTDTFETVFTAHEGPLSFDELLKVLVYMDVVALR